ncbi:MAG: membrane integrity-associated transporter subunit PqiC [Proteobacteria bacterium]|nr:membrane integrity-associated transporter subunit PqiC [Pseudomonadota bacterium]
MIKRSHSDRLKHAAISLLLLLGTLCLTSCFGSKTPERTYFSIDYALNTQPSEATPKYPKTVVIQNISTALAYDRQEIVYRANPYEFQYYWYRLWASKPRKMLGELITSHLRYTNLFQHVSSTIEDKLPDYLLDINISAIEELDVSDTEWYAHLGLHFTLQRPEDNTTVWTYQFDAKRPVASNQPVYVVKAMSELLDAELVKAFQDLDRTLSGKTSASSVSDIPKKVSEPPQATLLNKP